MRQELPAKSSPGQALPDAHGAEEQLGQRGRKSQSEGVQATTAAAAEPPARLPLVYNSAELESGWRNGCRWSSFTTAVDWRYGARGEHPGDCQSVEVGSTCACIC